LETSVPRVGAGLDGYLLKYNLITNTTVIPIAHDSHLLAYPNPSNGLVYFKSLNNADVHVYDISGREVNVGIQAETIDFGNVLEGLYTIVAIGKTGIQQVRIFKY
jgi:hypothetical protein